MLDGRWKRTDTRHPKVTPAPDGSIDRCLRAKSAGNLPHNLVRSQRVLIVLSALVMAGTVAGCARYGPLEQQWSFKTGDTIAATAAVNSNRVFIGSWDGYEYALDEATGALKWRTYLGRVP